MGGPSHCHLSVRTFATPCPRSSPVSWRTNRQHASGECLDEGESEKEQEKSEVGSCSTGLHSLSVSGKEPHNPLVSSRGKSAEMYKLGCGLPVGVDSPAPLGVSHRPQWWWQVTVSGEQWGRLVMLREDWVRFTPRRSKFWAKRLPRRWTWCTW